MKGTSRVQSEIIEKQVKRQIREEKDKSDRFVNITIKGLKDYGEKKNTKEITRDFFKDQLQWSRVIQQAQRIGKWMKDSKGSHVRVTLWNIGDKNMILRNKRFLKGAKIYLDKDLTIM